MRSPFCGLEFRECRGGVCPPDVAEGVTVGAGSACPSNAACHSIFVKSLARFAFRHPRGINFVYATRDLWLQNSPITKLCFVILTKGRI